MKIIGIFILSCSTLFWAAGYLFSWQLPFPAGFIIFVPNAFYRGIYLCAKPLSAEEMQHYNKIRGSKNKSALTDTEITSRRKKAGIAWMVWSSALVVFSLILL